MDFKQIKNAVREIKFEELRTDKDTSFEAVVNKDQLDKLIALLESFFGAPAFPSANTLSSQARQAIDAFGGIMPGQTLYYWNQNNEIIFAMLWPWGNGLYTTIKIIKP